MIAVALLSTSVSLSWTADSSLLLGIVGMLSISAIKAKASLSVNPPPPVVEPPSASQFNTSPLNLRILSFLSPAAGNSGIGVSSSIATRA